MVLEIHISDVGDVSLTAIDMPVASCPSSIRIK